MKPLKKYFTPFITGLIVLSLSSCASVLTNRKTDTAGLASASTLGTPLTTQLDSATSISEQAQEQTPVTTPSSNPSESKTATQTSNTVTVNIYQADNQCETLVSEKVAVPAESPVNVAVGQVLKQVNSSDFDLAGYRVNIDANSRIATVDLRLSPGSRRQFVSLSHCEQFALFGSLRKTLTDNSQLKIKDVRFTQQGQEIKL
ncbi:MAG TPA: sporulation/spore germination protein [Coleofasciculaceae cyanobacterium]|jgi:hypothetical protein